MQEERACAVVQGERGRQAVWKLQGIQVDESYYETVGESNTVDSRIRNEMTIAEQQFGFMLRRSTTDAIFCLRMLMEKWSEGQKAMHCVFIDLEKAYDETPREKMRQCLPLAETWECYVRVIKEIYDEATTTVRCAAGLTEEFEVGIGLNLFFCHHYGQTDRKHQEGSAMGYDVC